MDDLDVADATLVTLSLPEGLRFADLHLQRDQDGAVCFDAEPLRQIAAASPPEAAALLETEDGQCALIVAWYRVARERGEPPDPVAEDIAAEVAAEDAAGQRYSLPPGRA